MDKTTASKKGFPPDFLGVYDNDNKFVCVGCIAEDEDVDDEDKFTAVLKSDTWFHGAVCSFCHEGVGTLAEG